MGETQAVIAAGFTAFVALSGTCLTLVFKMAQARAKSDAQVIARQDETIKSFEAAYREGTEVQRMQAERAKSSDETLAYVLKSFIRIAEERDKK